MDSIEIRGVFPEMLIIRLFDHRIGVYHGSLNPWKLKRIAEEYDLDALVSWTISSVLKTIINLKLHINNIQNFRKSKVAMNNKIND